MSGKIFLLIGFLFFSQTVSGIDIHTTNRVFSNGFQEGNFIYFLVDTEILRKGDTVWFIAPIELPSSTLYRRIHFYCVNQRQPGLLFKLAEVRRKFAAPVNVKYSMFAKDGDQIVFAYLYGKKSLAGRSALDMFTWDPAVGYLAPIPEKQKESFYKDHFQNYRLPLDRNPGVLRVSDLMRNYLKDVSIPVPED